jgi:hypothetical protein
VCSLDLRHILWFAAILPSKTSEPASQLRHHPVRLVLQNGSPSKLLGFSTRVMENKSPSKVYRSLSVPKQGNCDAEATETARPQ